MNVYIKPDQNQQNDSPRATLSVWQTYLLALLDRNIPEAARPWYVRQLKSFIARLKGDGISLDRASKDDVANYLRFRGG